MALTLRLICGGVGASRPVLQGILHNAPDGLRRFRYKVSAIWLAPKAQLTLHGSPRIRFTLNQRPASSGGENVSIALI